MLKNYLIAFLILFSLSTNILSATVREIPEIGATEITLPNGIVVILKPLKDTEDILLRGFAPGGYSVLPPSLQSSGKLSAEIAWESGVGEWIGHALAEKLIHERSDLSLNVTPFSRSLEGATSMTQLPAILELIQQIYTAPRFDEKAMVRVVARERESVLLRHNDSDTVFEDAIRSVNTSDLALLHPITDDDLNHAQFGAARKYYLEQFLCTRGLTFVIVGDFDRKSVLPLVTKYLGSIPQKGCTEAPPPPTHFALPEGISRREVNCSQLQDCLARLTFPLKMEFTEDSWRQLEIVTQVIETRLRKRFRDAMGTTQGIDVAYELPYYPHPQPAWLTIQFRCPNCRDSELTRIVLEEFRDLARNGPTVEQLEQARCQQAHNDEFWLQHKRYWLGLLTNYSLWGWDLKNSVMNYSSCPFYQRTLIGEFIQAHLLTTHYTVVLLKPKR